MAKKTQKHTIRNIKGICPHCKVVGNYKEMHLEYDEMHADTIHQIIMCGYCGNTYDEMYSVSYVSTVMYIASPPVDIATDNMIPTKIPSTVIEAIGYDRNQKVLSVKLVTSDTPYFYEDVTAETYLDFLYAESAGVYYNKNIKGKYHTIEG